MILSIFSYLKYVSKPASPLSLESQKIKVTTSFYPLYYFTSQIGEGRIDVQNITPAGAEPHDYEPTSQDIARIEDSKLLVLNGEVEPWGDKIKDSLKDKPTKIIVAGDSLLNQKLVEEGEEMLDPHVWLSPQLAKIEVEKIAEGLASVDPNNSSYYLENSAHLKTELDQLDQDFKKGLSNCKKREFVTSHAAFGYLAKAYDLTQIAISGLSPDEEPSPQQLANIAKLAKEQNIKYIFFEDLVSPKLSETVANEIGAQTLVLNPLEGLTDSDIKEGKNFFTEMRSNLDHLREALECT